VWGFEVDGHRLHDPLIDISDEVGNYLDHGLLGFALDPDFLSNGYIYLMYVVDHHHLEFAGTPDYDPQANDYFRATIGRITRYTARSEDDFRSVDPGSRLVLVGETADSGFPMLHLSHGVGSLAFGTDGTLLASCGDGSTFNALDTGGDVGGSFALLALAEGIITPTEDVGSFRSQLVTSLNGKVIRIDPATGDGVPGNPFFDPQAPRSAQSRVWALGLRNPFRMTLRPGTGSLDPADGDPGVFYIGDVGGGQWEEINVADGPGMNFGWPLYEGMDLHPGFSIAAVANLDAPNPLFGVDGCDQSHFLFSDLLLQATTDPDPFFPNPCDPVQAIPDTVHTFVHARPAMDWFHDENGPARTGMVGAPGSPVTGPSFGGYCSIAGSWLTLPFMPPECQEIYFHGDYVSGWLRQFVFDGNEQPLEVHDFLDDLGGLVDVAAHPVSGELYYLDYSSAIHRVTFLPDGNLPPTAVAGADVTWGTSPLTVQFSGSGSSDPEMLPLTYLWDFGDGMPTSTEADPLHTFTAPAGVPTTYDVTLTVTDDGAATAVATLSIFVNNSPPSVVITSPIDGTIYPLDDITVYDLTADISDAEHGPTELSCAWQTILHHNVHQHPEPVDPNCITTTVISPIGCTGETYYFRIVLTVTDAGGLSASDEVLLFPPCGGCEDADLDDSGVVDISDLLILLGAWGDCEGLCPIDVRIDGSVNITDLLIVLSEWGACP
jgi:PKD repeat protein